MIGADTRLSGLSPRNGSGTTANASGTPSASGDGVGKSRFQQMLNEGRGKDDAKSATTTAHSARSAPDSRRANASERDTAPEAKTAAPGNDASQSKTPTDDADTENAPWPPLGLAALVLQTPAPLPGTGAAETADAPAIAPGVNDATIQPLALQNASLPAAVAPAAEVIADGEGEADITALNDASMTSILDSDAGNTGEAAMDPDAPMATSLQGLGAFLAGRGTDATASASRALDTLPPATPGAPGFDDAIGVRVGWMAEQKIGHAHIRLNPDALGTIDVHLQLDGDKLQASFSSPHVDVRHALESSLPRLRELLGEHGFQLAHADVGQQSTQDGRDQAGGSPRATAGDDAPEVTDVLRPAPSLLQRHGLLDAYA